MLQREIDAIGKRLVNCREQCAGIMNDPDRGILPRCLILERSVRSGRGCLVVGINPGRSKPRERAFYLKAGASYASVNAFWTKEIAGAAYYHRLRQFLDEIELSGPIIWSDLAKCEKALNIKGLIPLQTLRTCTGRFLQRELDATPPDWPVIGVGGEAYKALAYLEPTRTVLGVPHPTGSRGQFSALFMNDMLRPKVARTVKEALSRKTPIVGWISLANTK
jgi:hypothetical protein